MYEYIKGQIVSRQIDSLVIENQGIGYKILAAPELIERFGARGESAMIHTHLYVREDVMSLYGFPTTEELRLFDLLLGVSGIGPKVASAIVGAMPPNRFALAVMTSDIKSLTQIRGIGRKGAERLVLELKDKLKGSELPQAAEQGDLPVSESSSIQVEAINALMVLGYTSTQSAEAVGAVLKSGQSLEDTVKLALRKLF